MITETFYRQCRLRSGASTLMAWLEESRVKLGVRLTLKDSEKPEEFWEVVDVYETRLPEKYAKEQAVQNRSFWAHDGSYK